MEADHGLTRRIDQLIDHFNRRSLDLPDGLFDRRTQFLLNGRAFEDMLGRPSPPADATPAASKDPLILMLARGPAGYRFIVKAVQHAVPDARLQRGTIDVHEVDAAVSGRSECWLSGHLRGTSEAVELVFGVDWRMHPSGAVERAAVTMEPAAVTRLHEARLRS